MSPKERVLVTVWRRYLLLQVPGWLLAAVLLAALHHWLHLPPWVAIGLWALYVAKDFALFPFLRRGYESDSRTGAETLVGSQGTVRRALSPEGYVLVRGELWQAKVAEGQESLAQGTGIRVVGAEGLTLIVREDQEEVK